MITGAEPSPEHVRAVERYLVATVDHGFNASTFTARVVASTGADLAAAVVAALGAFSGPLHGGAPDRALAALDEIGTPDRIDGWVRGKLAAGERIMGFGHAVYTHGRPAVAHAPRDGARARRRAGRVRPRGRGAGGGAARRGSSPTARATPTSSSTRGW